MHARAYFIIIRSPIVIHWIHPLTAIAAGKPGSWLVWGAEEGGGLCVRFSSFITALPLSAVLLSQSTMSDQSKASEEFASCIEPSRPVGHGDIDATHSWQWIVLGQVGRAHRSQSGRVRGGVHPENGIKPDPNTGPNPHSPSTLRLLLTTFLSHPLYERTLTFTPSLITMKFFAAIPLILGAALQAVAQTPDANQAAELVADLKRAPTQLARLTILKNNEDVSIRLSSTLWSRG